MPNHYETLGVGGRATPEEIKRAYRSKAQLLHPDRHTDAGEAQTAAMHDAMASVNEAFRVLSDTSLRQAYDAALRSGRDPARERAVPWRPPQPGECDLCGHAPAVTIVIRAYSGRILSHMTYRLQAELCRSCGLSGIREMTNRTLITGWWGIVSYFLNWFALAANAVAWFKIRRLEQPQRQPNVVGPLPFPMPAGRPLYGRFGLWFAIALWTVVAVTGAADDSGPAYYAPTNSESTISVPPPPPTSEADQIRRMVGHCLVLDRQGDVQDVVPCSEPHTVQIKRVVPWPDGCPEYVIWFELPEGPRTWSICTSTSG